MVSIRGKAMKVCENCTSEDVGLDGENLCPACDATEGDKVKLRRQRAKVQRKAREDVMRSMGLVKVRGSLGGVYWE